MVRAPLSLDGGRRCLGVTRAGRRCSLTSDSKLTDERGRLVAEPLRRSGKYCIFHARPFCTRAADLAGAAVILLLDLETTGLDVSRDSVVEIGVAEAPAVAEAPGAAFATVVFANAPSKTTVHGIDPSEIAQGPRFPEAWARFIAFAEGLVNAAVHQDDDSDDDRTPRPPRPPDRPPELLLAAHNGHRFDFALLLFEVERHGLSWAPLERWRFVDTLDVLQAVGFEDVGGCFKLQCLARVAGGTENLRAHRALDDCVALRAVMEHVAARLGISLLDLLRPFVVELDPPASVAQVSALLEA